MRSPHDTSRSAPPARDGGFTLIEILVVIAILLMAVSLAAPSMRGMTDRTRTRSAVDQITGDVALARISAVREGRQTSLRFTGTATYTVTIDTSATDASRFRTVKTVDLSRDYGAVQITPSSGRLSFNSRGLLQPTSVTRIRVSRSTTADSVTISSVGRTYRDY